jgi:anti-sigma factor ChrR (cupin superfamily)
MATDTDDKNPLPTDIVSAWLMAMPAIDLNAATRAAIWSRIEARLAPRLHHALITAQTWQNIGHGIAVKMLSRQLTADTFMIRLDPGGEIPEHTHDGDEESVLLEGDAWIDGVYYGAVGDTHFAKRGTTHAPIRSPKGCVLWVRLAKG